MGGITCFADFEADRERFQLRLGSRAIKLERIPLELLFLLLENRGKLVSRAHIVARLWGGSVFVDTERGINTAVRKIRKALRDDPQHPQFIETVVGKGYRFVCAEGEAENPPPQSNSFAGEQCGHVGSEVTELYLRDFRVEAADGSQHLSCEVSMNNICLGRIAIAKLELPDEIVLPLNAKDRILLKLRGVRVCLTAQAAQAIHALSISALEGASQTSVLDPAA